MAKKKHTFEDSIAEAKSVREYQTSIEAKELEFYNIIKTVRCLHNILQNVISFTESIPYSSFPDNKAGYYFNEAISDLKSAEINIRKLNNSLEE